MTAGDRHLRMTTVTVLTLVLFLVWVPLDPMMPRPGIDESWMQAVNQAAAEHLRFGSDVVFNYGPLAAVHTHMYLPSIWARILLTSVLLAAGFMTAALTWLRSSHWIWGLLIAAFLLLDPVPRESLFLVYPLLLVLAVTEMAESPRLSRWRTGVMYAALGLLPLIKLSSLIPVGGALVCTLLVAVRHRSRTLGAIGLLVPFASTACFWLVSGQRLADLGPYLRSASWVTAGYSDAMAVPEHSSLGFPAVLVTVAPMILLLAVATVRAVIRDRTLLVPALMLGGTCLIAAKEALVRADVWHVFALWPVLAIGVWLCWHAGLAATLPRIASLVALAAVWGAMVATWPSFAFSESGRQASHTLAGPAHLVSRSPSSLRHQYDRIQADLARRYAMPDVAGSVDLYPDELGALFATGAQWDPRPGLQSMSAYTSQLATRNRDHLTGPTAPDSLVFGIGPIDGRLPALEDGASWLTILSRYQPTGRTAWGYQVLARRPAPATLPTGAAVTLHGRLGDWITLPPTSPGQGLEVSIDLSPTVAGRLRTMLWRPPITKIDLAGVVGPIASHRFLPGIGQVPFLISPYVASADQFVDLYTGGQNLDRVSRIRLYSDGLVPGAFWSGDVTVTARVVHLSAGD